MHISMVMKEGNEVISQDVIPVVKGIHSATANMECCSVMITDPITYHDTPSTTSICLDKSVIPEEASNFSVSAKRKDFVIFYTECDTNSADIISSHLVEKHFTQLQPDIATWTVLANLDHVIKHCSNYILILSKEGLEKKVWFSKCTSACRQSTFSTPTPHPQPTINIP